MSLFGEDPIWPITPVKQVLHPSFDHWGGCGHSFEVFEANFAQRMPSYWFYSLARLFSRLPMFASPSSPLLPRALHSTNSTFKGSWLNSKSLPFFPRYTLPPTEPSWELRAAERVTRKVFLGETRQDGVSHGGWLKHKRLNYLHLVLLLYWQIFA